jgi:hypothetical protein
MSSLRRALWNVPPRLPASPINPSESLQQRFDSSGLAASAAGVGRLALKYRARTGPQELRNLTDEQGADRLFRRAAIQGTCGNV